MLDVLQEFGRPINSAATYIVLLIIQHLWGRAHKRNWDVELRRLRERSFTKIIRGYALWCFSMAACFQIQLMGYFPALLNPLGSKRVQLVGN